MSERVKIPTSEQSAVLVLPSGEAKAPAVVVLQEYWGINDQIIAAAERWAAAGFIAVVPDLYHGKLATTSEEANALMKGLDWGKAVGEISAAVDFVRSHPRSTGKVAVSGYCMGGALAFASAVNIRGLAAVAPFYGLPGELDWSKVDAPIQAHFAKHDDWATEAGAKKIQEAVKVPMELFVYDAGHAFCNEKRPEAYNAEACSQAWNRTLEFVRKHV
ncbi:MAG: dienelactone hydrolase family protein [Kofleriaceae bacterium]